MGTPGVVFRRREHVRKAPKLYEYLNGKGTIQEDYKPSVHMTELD